MLSVSTSIQSLLAVTGSKYSHTNTILILAIVSRISVRTARNLKILKQKSQKYTFETS